MRLGPHLAPRARNEGATILVLLERGALRFGSEHNGLSMDDILTSQEVVSLSDKYKHTLRQPDKRLNAKQMYQ